MRRLLRENGLSIVLLVLFLLFMAGQVLTGLHEYNQDLLERGEEAIGVTAYLGSGHFWEATAENWESEFLQMAAYIVLTVMLFQRGSSESKDPDREEPVDRDPRQSAGKINMPGPVRRGGWVLKLYENSLSLVFVILFLLSIAVHAIGGAVAYSEEQVAEGRSPVAVVEYLQTTRFWFESFQNWQSEFLSLAAMVILTVFLRQRGSPESKPVDTPHGETGGD
jgi:Na+-transporting methylmalonyl-CoA/oxaloacetate decarboxylase gamma subunit